MIKIEVIKHNLNEILSNHKQYDFCEFISALRGALCISRQVMADDLEITNLKLFNLEVGNFRKIPDVELLSYLADYFGVKREVLYQKVKIYIDKKKGKIS